MNYAVIKTYDIANGPGVRVSLFVSGCRHHCPGCFNSEAWDFNYGKKFDTDAANKIFDASDKEYISGLSLLGGEPFEPENSDVLARFTSEYRERLPKKGIWCYTGFTFEDIAGGKLKNSDSAKQLLQNTDVLVDGKFDSSLHSPSLVFRGSSNQRIIDVPKSLKTGEPVWLDGVWERKMGDNNIYK